MPLISVALSTYNGERHLAAQLDSVLAQVEVELEVIAVDDGSSDSTCDVLDDYSARDPRLRWSRNEGNLGPTISFERAFGLCRGEFIAPCDQDDIWDRNKLRTLLHGIGSADLAYADSRYVDASGIKRGGRVSDSTRMLSGAQPLVFCFANSVSGHALLARREFVESAAPFPPGVYHDWWLAICAAAGNGVRYINTPLVDYRRHALCVSTMGRRGAPGEDWLQLRYRIIAAFAARDMRGATEARSLKQALDAARDGARRPQLRNALIANPECVPRRSGIEFIDRWMLTRKLSRKLTRLSADGPIVSA